MKGLVFCGGRGIRLRPITYYFQKVMIPIGSKQRPLLEYVIRLLRHHGIYDICLMVNYKANQIVNYFEDGSRFGVKISYIYDDPQLDGTGGALLKVYRSEIIDEQESLLIYYGDIISNINLSKLLKEHSEKCAAATIALSNSYPLPVGVAEVGKDRKILNFTEKPCIGKPVSIGILALTKQKTSRYLTKLVKNRKELDIMRDLIPDLIENNESVHAYITDAFWYDVGTTEKYEKMDNDFVNEKLKFLFE